MGWVDLYLGCSTIQFEKYGNTEAIHQATQPLYQPERAPREATFSVHTLFAIPLNTASNVIVLFVHYHYDIALALKVTSSRGTLVRLLPRTEC